MVLQGSRAGVPDREWGRQPTVAGRAAHATREPLPESSFCTEAGPNRDSLALGQEHRRSAARRSSRGSRGFRRCTRPCTHPRRGPALRRALREREALASGGEPRCHSTGCLTCWLHRLIDTVIGSSLSQNSARSCITRSRVRVEWRTPNARGSGRTRRRKRAAARHARSRPRVRSHHRFINRGTKYVRESGMKWMSDSTKQQHDRAPSRPGPRWTAGARSRRSRPAP